MRTWATWTLSLRWLPSFDKSAPEKCWWTVAGLPCKCSSQISWRWKNDAASWVPLQWVKFPRNTLKYAFIEWYFSWRHNWCEGARRTSYVWGEGDFWAEGRQESCSKASEGKKYLNVGNFLFKEHLPPQAKQVSMIAGGTGITPMLQLVS